MGPIWKNESFTAFFRCVSRSNKTRTLMVNHAGLKTRAPSLMLKDIDLSSAAVRQARRSIESHTSLYSSPPPHKSLKSQNLQLITGISSNKTGTIRLTTPASQYKNTPTQYQK